MNRPPADRRSTADSLGGRGRTYRRTCANAQCDEKPVNLKSPYEGELIPSLYCKQHTCRWQHSPFDEICCQVAAEPGQRFCGKHLKILPRLSCAAPDCLKQRTPDDIEQGEDADAPWFCPSHCCVEDGCHRQGDFLTKRCEKHKQCNAAHCQSRPDSDNDSNYCRRHTCKIPTCPYEAVLNNLCTDHQRCSYRACDKPRYRPDTLEDADAPSLCEAHFKQNARCASQDCRRPKEKGKGQYCSEHECKVGECGGERDGSGSSYCHKHCCRKDGCPNPLVNGSGTGAGPFCPKHTCKVPSCQRSTASANSPHCETHSCSKPGCSNPVDITASSTISGGKPLPPLCKIHKCKFASCSEEATPISETTAGYCLAKHGCIQTDCPKGRIYDDQGTPFERCADHERQRWKDAGRIDAEEAQEAKEDVRKKNELKKERQHNEEKEGLKKEIKELRDIINGPRGFEAFREELEELRERNAELEDLRLENADLRAEIEGLRAAHETPKAGLRKGRRPSMAAAGPGGYAAFGPPGGHQFPGPGAMPIPGMNGSKLGGHSPTGRSFRGSSAWDTSRDSLLSHQYDDQDHPYYSEEDRGGTPTDISFDNHSSDFDPSQPQRGRIRDVPRDWREPPTPGREPRARDARELRDKSRGRVRGGTTETIKDAGAVARSPRDKSKPRRTKSKHRGTATGGYGAFDTMRRRSGAGLSQWQGDPAAQAQAPPLSSRRSKTFGTGTGKPRPVSMMAGSVPDVYAGGYGHPVHGHMGYWAQHRGHDQFESEE